MSYTFQVFRLVVNKYELLLLKFKGGLRRNLLTVIRYDHFPTSSYLFGMPSPNFLGRLS